VDAIINIAKQRLPGQLVGNKIIHNNIDIMLLFTYLRFKISLLTVIICFDIRCSIRLKLKSGSTMCEMCLKERQELKFQ